jgi:membrane-associated phospholipid phosphatase
MQNTTQGIHTPTATTTAGGENRQEAQKRHHVEIALWFIGFILFIASCVIIHGHPMPYSFDLATTETEQHIQYAPWLLAFINFPSVLNNPLPSEIALGLWFVALIVVGVIRRIRKLPALVWFQAAVGLLISVMFSSFLNVLIDEIVARPRPNSHTEPIHIYTPIVPFPTYPSGHTEHDMVYYGFLLYLSFTKPVREWKYAWILIPFQIFAVYNIILIGYSRILLGDHWLTDVLGGYLEGILELFIFIFLYRLATDIIANWRAKRMQRV